MSVSRLRGNLFTIFCPASSFFQSTSPTATSSFSLHDALPISCSEPCPQRICGARPPSTTIGELFCSADASALMRSEEHTSELQSLRHLVCRLLLEKQSDAPHTQSAKP